MFRKLFSYSLILICLINLNFTRKSHSEGIKQNENDENSKYMVNYRGTKGPGVGKNIVMLASDHEYRSEESLPELAKILSKRYGFNCTVIFGLDEKGNIFTGSSDMRGLEILDTADLLVLFTRFSHFESEELQHIDDYIHRGKPIIALRTATHAFAGIKDPKWEHYNWNYKGENAAWKDGFGEFILGETWVAHYGTNHKQSSNLTISPDQKNNPIFKGVKDRHVQSGAYTIQPKGDVLASGQVLNGMTTDSKPDETKAIMPAVWTRNYKLENGASGRVFATTHGAAEDLLNEGFRRMLINASLWAMGMEKDIKASNNVDLVGPFKPTTFNFDGYKTNVKPSDLAGWDSLIMPGEVFKKK